MTDMLASVRSYLPSLEPFVTENDVKVIEVLRWKLDLSNIVIIEALWDDEDYRVAEGYHQRLCAGEIPPAVILNGNTIEDGHHRIYAYRKFQNYSSRTTIPAIDLAELCAIVDAWYDIE